MEECFVIEDWPKIDWKVLFQKLPVQSPIFNIRDMVCHLYFEEKSERGTSKEYFELILRGKSEEIPEFLSFYSKTYILDLSQNIRFEENDLVTRSEKSFEYCIWRVSKERLQVKLSDMVGDCESLKFMCFFGPSLEYQIYKETVLKLRESFKENTNLDMLSSCYMKLFDEGLMKDVIIICKDENIHAHKILLSVRCKTFAKILQEDYDGAIDLSNMLSSEFRAILGYIYSGKLPEITLSNVYEIYKASYIFQLDALKVGCANFIISELTVTSSLSCLHYAQKCNDTILKLAICAFLRFSKAFLKADTWREVHDQFRTVTSWNIEDENLEMILPKLTIE